MSYNHKVSVAALVTNDGGKILLVNSPWRGWEYPGGLIEPGETFEEALHREVREESGVEIEITGFVGICKNVGKDIVNIDFTARSVGGELTTSEESTEVGWFTAEEAFRMLWCWQDFSSRAEQSFRYAAPMATWSRSGIMTLTWFTMDRWWC